MYALGGRVWFQPHRRPEVPNQQGERRSPPAPHVGERPKVVVSGGDDRWGSGGRDFLEIELRDAIEAGIAVGPHLVVATRPITHSGGHCWYMGGEADTPASIRRVARENLRSGADCLKIMATGGAMTPIDPPAWRPQFSVDEIKIAVEAP